MLTGKEEGQSSSSTFLGVVQEAYLNRDRRLRLIIGTVRSRRARKKVTNKRESGGGGGDGTQ